MHHTEHGAPSVEDPVAPLPAQALGKPGEHAGLTRWGAAYVAMPGHKGLYGPQGTGLLLCGEGSAPRTLLEAG